MKSKKYKRQVDHYKQDHKTAKTVICSIVIMLVMISKYVSFPVSLIIEALAVITWFFGVNPMGYLVEKVRKHKHKHDLL